MTDTVPSIGSFDLVNQDHCSLPNSCGVSNWNPRCSKVRSQSVMSSKSPKMRRSHDRYHAGKWQQPQPSVSHYCNERSFPLCV